MLSWRWASDPLALGRRLSIRARAIAPPGRETVIVASITGALAASANLLACKIARRAEKASAVSG